MNDKNDNGISDVKEFWIAVAFATFFSLIGTVDFLINDYTITGSIITVFGFALGLIGGENIRSYLKKKK